MTKPKKNKLRDRPLENFVGRRGGGGAEVPKNIRAREKGKLNEKNSCTQINPKNIHAMA